MIRRITLIFAVAAIALVASCNKVDQLQADGGEKVAVKYQVSLDIASGLTKAGEAENGQTGDSDGTAEYGVGTEIDTVLALVYTVSVEEEVTEYHLFSRQEIAYSKDAPIEFDLEFFRNQQYKVVFVAYDPDAYTVSDDAIMTYKSVQLAPEQYDAFVYAGDVTFSEADADVTLSRPFALWKVYTTDGDVASSGNLGAQKIDNASVAAKVNTSYNILSGEFSNPAVMTFKRVFPADDSQKFDEVKHTLLSAQYIMPSGNVDMNLAIFAGATEVSNINVPNVPTTANSKVNIYGRLATAQYGFTITLNFGIVDDIDHPIV